MTIASTWKEYNKITLRLSNELGRSDNIVGEYAEHLVNEYLNGSLLSVSHKSADIVKDGKRYQVKARRVNKSTTTQLGIIRSWDFDYLAVILFDKSGGIKSAYIVPAAVAKEISVENSHQNGYVITTNRNFFHCRIYTDITDNIKILNGEKVKPNCSTVSTRTRYFKKLHKIERWAKHPGNINHRIIKAYLKLLEKHDVRKDDLRALCSDSISRAKFYVEKFNGNFSSMKTDAGKSNGKVFFEDNGFVFIYPQVMAEIKKYFAINNFYI